MHAASVPPSKGERAALREATEIYGNACIDGGYSPLAVAIAGTSEDDFAVRVHKWNGSAWKAVTYEGNPIGWIPNRVDVERLRVPSATPELRPSVPSPEVLANFADEINRLLRESNVNDRSRPSVVGACMLALWQSKGALRKDPRYILGDINQECVKAFWNAGKVVLGGSCAKDVLRKVRPHTEAMTVLYVSPLFFLIFF